MGLEPITNKGTDFKSAVYTIPPSAKKKIDEVIVIWYNRKNVLRKEKHKEYIK